MKVLQLALRRKWFEAIRDGSKLEEYRLASPYWKRRLEGKTFDKVVLTLGYPPREDLSRRIESPWLGVSRRIVQSEEWDNEPRDVFVIPLRPTNTGEVEG